MIPSQLTTEKFVAYPPEARGVVANHLAVLQQLPLCFIPLLLRETISYDWKFPAERKELDRQFLYLSAKSQDELRAIMAGFTKLQLSPALERVDWVNKPTEFSEQLTAHLWATHQIDAFRTAAIEYVGKMNAAAPTAKVATPRLAIAIIGQGVQGNDVPLFRKLRPHGTLFTNLDPKDGQSMLLQHAVSRAVAKPEPFAHWYINASTSKIPGSAALTSMSYAATEPIRKALVTKMREVMQPGGGGPEKLRTMLAQMTPEDLGLNGAGAAAVLNRFQISVLTEGSGTQLFSTTFAQGAAREALRRAQPLTLVLHFGPRVREASMNELIAGSQRNPVPDPQGALIDADMGAYYTWINLQRLPGSEQSRFLAWFEDHDVAIAVSPALARGRESSDRLKMAQVLDRL